MFFSTIILHESKSSVHFSRGNMHMEETLHRNTNLNAAMVYPMPFLGYPQVITIYCWDAEKKTMPKW